MLNEAIKYCDFFGIKYNFFTEGKPKLYTLLGGILSIISIIICLLVFFSITSEDIRRNNPTITTSTIHSEGYKKIKFGKEKIWLPWRIVDYHNTYVNHTGLIYPIIFYYYGQRKNITEPFDLHHQLLKYKLCNETSMAEKPEFYQMDVPLNQLYCVDMDDIEMGGSWISNFLNYIEMDLYLCENGIDYDGNSSLCTTRDSIINKTGLNNSLKAEFFYPVVQFQPNNIKTPVIVLYRQYFYHISIFSTKIHRLFLQEHILMDDLGWMTSSITNSTYWGFSRLSGDSYALTDTRDLYNEGSTSRIYSINLYLEPGIILYSRKYKKILLIIAEGLPIMLAVFSIFEKIANIFKFAEENKKLVELLFENLKEKKDKFKQSKQKVKISENKIKESHANLNPNRLMLPQDISNLKLYSDQKLPKINLGKEENNAIKILNDEVISYTPVINQPNIVNKKFHSNCVRKNELDLNVTQKKRYEKLKLFP